MNILSFSPYAAIWQHAYPEAITLGPLRDIGKLTYLYCDGIFFDYCVAMSAYGIKPQDDKEKKIEVCRKCKNNLKIIKRHFDYDFISIESLLDSDDYESIKIYRDNVLPSDFDKFELGGLAIGKMATYEVLLENKKNSLLFDEREWKHYQINFYNSLLTYFAIKKLYSTTHYDRVLMYNTLYATNNTVYSFAKLNGSVVYCMHAGMNWHNRLQTMIISKDSTFFYEEEVSRQWPKYKNHVVSADGIRLIGEHFSSIVKSATVFNYSASYSKNFDIRGFFGISKEQKILVASMSSYDERFAYGFVGQLRSPEPKIFKMQMDWIEWLIDYFADKDEIFLIIRVHPREFPNRRMPIMSDNAKKMMEIFTKLPNNIKVNWPDDNISIYSLAKESDVLLNAHSSAALDFMLLGAPVVIYDMDIQTFPVDLFYFGGYTEIGYVEAINRAINDGRSFENTRKVFRWMNVKLNLAQFNLSDTVWISERREKNIFKKIVNKIINKYFWTLGANLKCFFRKKSFVESVNIKNIVLGGHNTKLDVVNYEYISSERLLNNEEESIKEVIKSVL